MAKSPPQRLSGPLLSKLPGHAENATRLSPCIGHRGRQAREASGHPGLLRKLQEAALGGPSSACRPSRCPTGRDRTDSSPVAQARCALWGMLGPPGAEPWRLAHQTAYPPCTTQGPNSGVPGGRASLGSMASRTLPGSRAGPGLRAPRKTTPLSPVPFSPTTGPHTPCSSLGHRHLCGVLLELGTCAAESHALPAQGLRQWQQNKPNTRLLALIPKGRAALVP